MILKNFYYGTKQVLKIIQNGRVIWDCADPISLVATVVGYSFAKGTLHTLVEFQIGDGSAENDTNGSGVLRCLFEDSLFGIAECDSDSIATLRKLDIVKAISNDETNAESFVILRPFGALISAVNDENHNYASGVGGLYSSIESAADERSETDITAEMGAYRGTFGGSRIPIESDVFSTSHVLRNILAEGDNSNASVISAILDRMYPIMVESLVDHDSGTYAHAGVYAVVFTEGGIKSTSDSDALILACPLVGITGGNESTSTDKVIILCFDAVNLSVSGEYATNVISTPNLYRAIISIGAAQNGSYGASTLRYYDILSMRALEKLQSCIVGISKPHVASVSDGNGESGSNTIGGLSLWYLPMQENDTLYVRQAYSATVNNGVLEVI